MEQARTSLEALIEIAHKINSIEDSDVLLEKVLEIAMDTLGAERGFILLKSTDRNEGFEVKSVFNFSEQQLSNTVRLSTSVVHRVLHTGEPVLVYEAPTDERFQAAESIILQQIQSIACVPLSSMRRQVGAIYLDCLSDRTRFRRDNLPFLGAFASLAAIAIDKAGIHQALKDENRQLRTEVQHAFRVSEIVGKSPKMKELFRLISLLANKNTSVLIHGESGVGKELVARAIHYNGRRKDEPFMALFCGSLPDNLLESELFGYKKGAFTGALTDKIGLFEAADNGTIFLDEVGDLSHSMQTALLRVLQEGEIKRVGENETRQVNVRVISATNKPLKEMVAAGDFREDLFYRLNTFTLDVPALRQRKEDIPLLAQHFLKKLNEAESPVTGIAPEALKLMESHNWPGNVRELENAIERALVLATDSLLSAEHFDLEQGISASFTNGKTSTEAIRQLVDDEIPMMEVEHRMVKCALEQNNDNLSKVARKLGVTRSWIHYRMKKWDSQTP